MGPALLLYDGGCGPCTAFARMVKMADLRGRIEARPLGEPEMAARYGARLGYLDSFHLDTGRGVASGADALPDLLGLLPGGLLWRPLARLPPCRAALSLAYRRLSGFRSGCASEIWKPGAF